MSAICRRSWRNMSAISTTGARIDRWDNGRLVHRYHARIIETLKLERSSRYLCSEVFITFISNQHDDGADLILAPYNGISGVISVVLHGKSQTVRLRSDSGSAV